MIDLNTSINKALVNSHLLKYAEKNIESHKTLLPTSFALEKTELYVNYDENNITHAGYPLTNIGIQQSFQFPGYYINDRRILMNQYEAAQLEYIFLKQRISFEMALLYIHIYFTMEKIALYQTLDSIFSKVYESIKQGFESGNISQKDFLTIQLKQIDLKQLLFEQYMLHKQLMHRFHLYVGDTTLAPDTVLPPLEQIKMDSLAIIYQEFFQNQIEQHHLEWKSQKYESMPDFYVLYFLGSNRHETQKYHGFEVGISIPLLNPTLTYKIKSSKLKSKAYQHLVQNEQQKIQTQLYENWLAYQMLLSLQEYYQQQNEIQEKFFHQLLLNSQSENINLDEWFQIFDSFMTYKLKHLDYLETMYTTYFKIKYGIYEE
ncbi:MAG: TolC family protein [Bacteroidales bacterium]|nr:TolC family protein [Bacteroidales bacterium]